MVTEDWIDVLLIYDDYLQVPALRSLFEYLMDSPDAVSDKLDIAAWNDVADINHTTGTASNAANAISEYRDSTIGIEFEGYKIKVGSGYTEGPLSNTPHLTLRTPIEQLSQSEDTNRIFRYLSKIAQCVERTEPILGIGRPHGFPSRELEDVVRQMPRLDPLLYEYNVFSSELVEDLGRDRVLSAPAYYVEELDSGGVFMAVTEPPKQCGHEGQQCEAVADQLGLDLANPERYH